MKHGGKRIGAGRKKSAPNMVYSITDKEELFRILILRYGRKNLTNLTKQFWRELKNKSMKNINVNGVDFVIQSYLKDDFCYLVSTEMSSIRINFLAYHLSQAPIYVFESNQKTGKDWFDFVDKINIEQIEKELSELFHCS